MGFKALENMGDEEMAGKFMSIGAILKVFGGIFFDKVLSSPIKFARIFKFSLKLKKIAEKTQEAKNQSEKLDSTILLIDMILKYRHTNPKEMEAIFETLEEIVQRYTSNPNVKQEILNIMGQKSNQ